MAIDPAFGVVPVIGSSVVSATADTSYTAPTHAVTLLGGQGPRQVTDGVTNSTTLLTSASAAWNSGDVGRPVSGAGIPNGTVIAFVTSSTNVVMSQPATGPASSVTVTLGGGVGTLVPQITLNGTGITVAGVVQTYLYDGTAYHFDDSFLVTVVSPSTTVVPFQLSRPYQALWIPPTWTLVATSFAASQLVNVTARGLNA